MKTLLFTLLLCLPLVLSSQITDTSKVIAEADSLLKLARTQLDHEESAKAFETNELAGSIISEKLGETTASYVVYLLQKGFVLLRQSKYPESEPILLAALSLEEQWSGKNTPNYVRGLDYLGYAYWRLSRYEESEKALLEALEIGESVVGKEHEDYLSALDYLANLYRQIGRNEEAKAHCMEALRIKEKVFGKVSETYSSSLTTLAAIYARLGDFQRTEQCNLEALEIIGKVHGKEHQRYALILNNLAMDYIRFGNYEVAEPMLLEAKEIRLKVLGRDHVDYAETLGYLGSMYSDMGAYEQSETYYLEARAILEKNQGKMNSDYALITNNNANLYFKMGKLEEAKTLYLEALEIRENIYGKEHRFYASTLNNLAYLYLFTDEIEKAEPFMLEANALNLKMLGSRHLRYSYSLNHLVNLYWKKRQFEEANVYLEKSWSIQRSSLIQGSKHLSEEELRHYANLYLPNVYKTFSLAGKSPNPQFAANSYDLALFYKGYLQTTSKQMRRLVKRDRGTIIQFDTLQSYQARLAKEYAKRLPAQDSQVIADLEYRSERLEKELVQTLAGFGVATRQVTWQQVQENLNPGEVAIEFVHYELVNPDLVDTVLYAAIVLRPNEASPHFVPLATESQLEAILKKSDNQPDQYVNRLYSAKESALFQLIWQPLEPLLEDTKVVYYSPAGLLHRLNLSAVSRADQSILADHYRLIRLGSTRQLTEPQSKDAIYQDAMLFGGIQYEMDSVLLSKESMASRGKSSVAEPIPFSATNSSLRGGNWDYLQWTEVEIDAIDLILQDAGIKTTVKRDYTATEEAFKSIGVNSPSPNILHLATHGFFFPDPVEKIEGDDNQDDSAFELSDHSMIRSGLILAGANHAWQTGQPIRSNMEDGVLTAYEISHMNLSNTDLVVLSACETGLGDIKGNEGVYGLQRAFKIAGAKYLIMSLWQVPDFQTQELMTTFYLNWLDAKMSIREAFYAAQASVRKKYPEPFYWAGFVLVE